MKNKFLKIALCLLLCAQTTPALATINNESAPKDSTKIESSSTQVSLSEDEKSDPKISTVSDTGAKIDAYYDSKTAKYYLFMMASDDKLVTVTYVDSEGKEATADLDFTETDELSLIGTIAGDVLVVWKKSTIPSLYIDLNGTTLEEIQKDKTKKYGGNDVVLDDPTGESSLSASNVEIKGRGNSSWTAFDKKSYQIKFEKKTSVLGMAEAKKWCLISNASDDSLVRNKVAYHLSEELGVNYAIDCRYVDLWIEGDYQGNYLVTEKVEIGKNRVNLSDENGILVEWDENFYKEEDYWFKNDKLDAYFAVKETVNEEEDHIKSTMTSLNDSLTKFGNYLFDTDKNDVTIEGLSKYVDVESMTQFYLINEYLSSRESVSTSWYWYKDGDSDVLHMGPVWDFDSSMNYYGTNEEVYIYLRNIFGTLLSCPAYRTYIEAYYGKNLAYFDELSDYATAQASEIASSVEMNYIRWDVLGKDGKAGYKNHDTWELALKAGTDWLTGRKTGFYICDTRGLQANFDDENSVVSFLYYPFKPNTTATFALWNDSNEKSTKMTINATKNSDGSYEGSQSLYVYDVTGKFILAAFSDEKQVATYEFTSDDFRVEMYRLYNPYTGEHFYTSSISEKYTLEPLGWKGEGTAWISPKKSNTPIYRLYNPYEGDHHYTTSADERDKLKKSGWRYEGIGWYSLDEGFDNKIKVLRQYNPNAKTGAHNFTIDTKERDNLVKLGWKDEGTAWWAFSS